MAESEPEDMLAYLKWERQRGDGQDGALFPPEPVNRVHPTTAPPPSQDNQTGSTPETGKKGKRGRIGNRKKMEMEKVRTPTAAMLAEANPIQCSNW